MAEIVFHDCGIHVSLKIAGKMGEQMEAVRTIVKGKIDEHYRLGDISPTEKKRLTEEIKTHPKLFDTEEEMIQAIVKRHPQFAEFLKATKSVDTPKMLVLIVEVVDGPPVAQA